MKRWRFPRNRSRAASNEDQQACGNPILNALAAAARMVSTKTSWVNTLEDSSKPSRRALLVEFVVQRGFARCCGEPGMIRVDAVWLAMEPLDMRAGTDTALGRVVKVFGAAPPHQVTRPGLRLTARLRQSSRIGPARAPAVKPGDARSPFLRATCRAAVGKFFRTAG